MHHDAQTFFLLRDVSYPQESPSTFQLLLAVVRQAPPLAEREDYYESCFFFLEDFLEDLEVAVDFLGADSATAGVRVKSPVMSWM